MSFLSIISIEVIKSIANKTSDTVISKVLGKHKTNLAQITKDLPVYFENHLIELINWSFDIPFIGLSKPKNVESSTIELVISSAISKFDSSDELISENDLLISRDNILLLGHPGAGKTTTLKRIILKYFQDGYENFEYDFPILLRFRNLKHHTTIAIAILDLLGIPYYFEYIKKEKKGSPKERIWPPKVGNMPIDIFVPQFLNETRALLILDGLDEASEGMQGSYQQEIEQLSLKLNRSKIIFTVRKSKLSSIETRFIKYEIKPLSEQQIREIAGKWIKDDEGFYSALIEKPYRDLANRPIFLTLLMILYVKFNELPIQPNEVYKESAYLIIKDWDEHRLITRKSKYADFNTRRKLKFLSEISYYLTYKIKRKQFTRRDLEFAYRNIYSKYNLPHDEASNVISEIESHNGIIAEAGYNTYEFSHLSIQEYLCAEYLVTLPISKQTITYFYEYPDPLAIAICISGDPGLWLANLLLNKPYDIHDFDFSSRGEERYKKSMYNFLNRLILELPSFSLSHELGFAILRLLVEETLREEEIYGLFINLFNLPYALLSLNEVLKEYKVKRNYINFIEINLNVELNLNKFYNIVKRGKISKLLFTKSNLRYDINSSRSLLIYRILQA